MPAAASGGTTGAATPGPTNIARYFTQHFATPERALHRHFAHDAWVDVTVGEVRAYAERWQEAFRRAGLVAGDRVALCARNGIFWVAIDQAALGMGLVVVPLYVDDNAENVAWCAQNAGSRLFIVENARMADSLAGAMASAVAAAAAAPVSAAPAVAAPAATLPAATPAAAVPRVVVLRAADDDVRSAARFLPESGQAFQCLDLPPSTLATICYTSGTSGKPKGVMLSHGNIVANVEQCRATALAHADDAFLSILPLSHMFERTGGYYLPLAIGARVIYARGIAQIPDDLASQRPTAMFAVPRIFERFHARVQQTLAESPAKKRLFDYVVGCGYRLAMRKASLLDRVVVALLRRRVAAPVLDRLGGRMRIAVVGGAAFEPEIARMFVGLGLALLQGYGMTEASPVISVNRDDDNVPESVGPPLPGVEVKLGENAELLARGANVMLGYWGNEEATRASLTADGWLRTGDIAEIREGRIYIRGRAKDILVMSNGEKLSPQDAELAIMHDPAFEQVMLVGEGKPYPILLAVSQDGDEKTLQKRANDMLKDFPRWVRVRRVIATREPWTVDNGLLTPTLKLKRPLVLARYKDAIERAYTEGSATEKQS